MPFPYKPQQDTSLYGLHIPYDKGYDAWSRRNASSAERKGSAGYLLRPNGAQVDLWITDVTADFSLSGQRAQSRMIREFFPRSFNDVTLAIKGNVANTQQFNRLSAFIREHHWRALQYINQGGTATQTLTFGLHDKTPAAWKPASRPSDVVVNLIGDVPAGKQSNVKGSHRPWQVQGYVKAIAGGAVAQEVAPEFEINFIVAESELSANTGLWSDIAGQPSNLKTILQLFHDANVHHTGGFIKDPAVATAAPSTPAPTGGSSPTPSSGQTDTGSLWSVQAAGNVFNINNPFGF